MKYELAYYTVAGTFWGSYTAMSDSPDEVELLNSAWARVNNHDYLTVANGNKVASIKADQIIAITLLKK